MRRISMVYGLIAVIIGGDRLLRRGSTAVSLRAGESDRSSHRALRHGADEAGSMWGKHEPQGSRHTRQRKGTHRRAPPDTRTLQCGMSRPECHQGRATVKLKIDLHPGRAGRNREVSYSGAVPDPLARPSDCRLQRERQGNCQRRHQRNAVSVCQLTASSAQNSSKSN
jgi:hypothetical protein